MDGFFTDSFLEKFPENLYQSLFNEHDSFYDLFMSMKRGSLIAGANGKAFLDMVESLKKSNPELYYIVMSLESSGKLQKRVTKNVSAEFQKLRMKKSVLQSVGSAFSQEAASVYHDMFENNDWKEQMMVAGRKPLIDERDLNNGKIGYLFKEISYPLNKGDEFNWARFLAGFVYPFQRIRIMDPYLYVKIRTVDLKGMVKTLAKRSGPELKIEIISNLSADSGRESEDVRETVNQELEKLGDLKSQVKIYTQTGSASKFFHKRIIWTDFWVLLSDHGLDFFNLETGKGTVDKENVFFMTGKYSSNRSLWYQVDCNWPNYLNKVN